MAIKKAANTRTSKSAVAPARKKLALKKDALKDLTAVTAGPKVKGGAYSRLCGSGVNT